MWWLDSWSHVALRKKWGGSHCKVKGSRKKERYKYSAFQARSSFWRNQLSHRILMKFHITLMFKSCEDCSLKQAKKGGVKKKTVANFKTLWERLFFDICSPSTPTFASKKHWLFVIEKSANSSWRYFLKEKSELKNVMMFLIKDSRAM